MTHLNPPGYWLVLGHSLKFKISPQSSEIEGHAPSAVCTHTADHIRARSGLTSLTG